MTWCFGTPPPNEKSWFQYRTRRLPEASNCKILIGFSLSAVQISGRSGSSAFTGKPVTETKTPLSESPSASTSSRLAVLTRTGGKYALQKTKKSYPESRPRAGGAAVTQAQAFASQWPGWSRRRADSSRRPHTVVTDSLSLRPRLVASAARWSYDEESSETKRLWAKA